MTKMGMKIKNSPFVIASRRYGGAAIQTGTGLLHCVRNDEKR